MNNDRLSFGHEPNLLVLKVDNDIQITPATEIRDKNLVISGLIVRVSRYNLDNVLCQMLEDYGEDDLLKRIKSL